MCELRVSLSITQAKLPAAHLLLLLLVETPLTLLLLLTAVVFLSKPSAPNSLLALSLSLSLTLTRALGLSIQGGCYRLASAIEVGGVFTMRRGSASFTAPIDCDSSSPLQSPSLTPTNRGREEKRGEA